MHTAKSTRLAWKVIHNSRSKTIKVWMDAIFSPLPLYLFAFFGLVFRDIFFHRSFFCISQFWYTFQTLVLYSEIIKAVSILTVEFSISLSLSLTLFVCICASAFFWVVYSIYLAKYRVSIFPNHFVCLSDKASKARLKEKKNHRFSHPLSKILQIETISFSLSPFIHN